GRRQPASPTGRIPARPSTPYRPLSRELLQTGKPARRLRAPRRVRWRRRSRRRTPRWSLRPTRTSGPLPSTSRSRLRSPLPRGGTSARRSRLSPSSLAPEASELDRSAVEHLAHLLLEHVGDVGDGDLDRVLARP